MRTAVQQSEQLQMIRTRFPIKTSMRMAVLEPDLASIRAERARRCRESLYYTLKYFWSDISLEEFKPNWHIEYLCNELMRLVYRVAEHKPKDYDLIINVPPGTTKTITCSIVFPVWCWMNWYWMQFICWGYSAALSLESAEKSRDLVRSNKFSWLFPSLDIKQDKDQKGNFRIVKKLYDDHGLQIGIQPGGNRFSTSVGGTLTGFHAHFLIGDDPLNPKGVRSKAELQTTNYWIDQVLSTRKVDKAITPSVLIMQRLDQSDPTGHALGKKKGNIRHICFPGEIRSYRDTASPTGFKENFPLTPLDVINQYRNDLLDPIRMPWPVLKEMEADLGQYGYAGQIQQNPTPPGGGMFKVDRFQEIERMPEPINIKQVVRYWDKAGSTPEEGATAYTVGTKMARVEQIGMPIKFIIMDVKRGQWSSEVREAIIKATAEADGVNVGVYHEQEPGSGGKESAQGTTDNLVGFSAYSDRPVTNKVARADRYSVQVNNGNVQLLKGDWIQEFKEEHRYFPFSKTKDQVDSASGAFSKLVSKKKAWVL